MPGSSPYVGAMEVNSHQDSATDVSFKPARKRKRIVISCTECHRRKQKVRHFLGSLSSFYPDFVNNYSVIACCPALTVSFETSNPPAIMRTNPPL
jgi:hypothetical protein